MKQCLWLNPTFIPELHTNNTNTHSSINNEDVDDDDDAFLFEDDADPSGSWTHDNAVPSMGSFCSEESSGNNVFTDTTELPVESDYSCFTTSQQCVTSLMYLLDTMNVLTMHLK